MWQCTPERLAGPKAQRYVPQRDGAAIPYGEVVRLWQHDESFRSFFISLLASSEFVGFRWETPPVTTARADRPFEFVLLDAVGLDRAPDVGAFAEHFGRQVSVRW